jgi:hypothetical protein
MPQKGSTQLNERLVGLREKKRPHSIETGIAATAFSFLLNDMDAAENRLKRLGLSLSSDFGRSPSVADLKFRVTVSQGGKLPTLGNGWKLWLESSAEVRSKPGHAWRFRCKTSDTQKAVYVMCHVVAKKH